MTQGIVQTLPDGAPRLVETGLATDRPVIFTPVDSVFGALPADTVPAGPQILGGVRIAGVLEVGALAEIEIGGVSGSPTPEVRVRWFVDGAVQPGQSATQLQITRAMRGRTLTAELELRNRFGVSRQFAAPRVVAGPTPIMLTSGTLQVEIGPEGAIPGDVVRVTRLLAADIDATGLTYSWQADGVQIATSAEGVDTTEFAPGVTLQLLLSDGGLPETVPSNTLTLAEPAAIETPRAGAASW